MGGLGRPSSFWPPGRRTTPWNFRDALAGLVPTHLKADIRPHWNI